jgi:hypothetical protein
MGKSSAQSWKVEMKCGTGLPKDRELQEALWEAGAVESCALAVCGSQLCRRPQQ